jgi:protein TonB
MRISSKKESFSKKVEENVRKPQKKDVNLKTNTALYFQIGLIMCLLTAYGALEYQFETKDFKVPVTAKADVEEDYMFAPVITVAPDAVETSEPLSKQPVRPDNITMVIDDTPDKNITEQNLISDIVQATKPEGTKPSLDEGSLDVIEPDEEVHINFVEKVPVYPGCESANSNDQRKKCMSEKLAKLIKKKFDRNLGAELGLREGVQRIYVNFRINKFGIVEIMSTRAPHKDLQKEANRVVDKVPQMKPGEQGGKPVSVLYSLPIIFEVKY